MISERMDKHDVNHHAHSHRSPKRFRRARRHWPIERWHSDCLCLDRTSPARVGYHPRSRHLQITGAMNIVLKARLPISSGSTFDCCFGEAIVKPINSRKTSTSSTRIAFLSNHSLLSISSRWRCHLLLFLISRAAQHRHDAAAQIKVNNGVSRRMNVADSITSISSSHVIIRVHRRVCAQT